jgi:hypothetical protein
MAGAPNTTFMMMPVGQGWDAPIIMLPEGK